MTTSIAPVIVLPEHRDPMALAESLTAHVSQSIYDEVVKTVMPRILEEQIAGDNADTEQQIMCAMDALAHPTSMPVLHGERIKTFDEVVANMFDATVKPHEMYAMMTSSASAEFIAVWHRELPRAVSDLDTLADAYDLLSLAHASCAGNAEVHIMTRAVAMANIPKVMRERRRISTSGVVSMSWLQRLRAVKYHIYRPARRNRDVLDAFLHVLAQCTIADLLVHSNKMPRASLLRKHVSAAYDTKLTPPPPRDIVFNHMNNIFMRATPVLITEDHLGERVFFIFRRDDSDSIAARLMSTPEGRENAYFVMAQFSRRELYLDTHGKSVAMPMGVAVILPAAPAYEPGDIKKIAAPAYVPVAEKVLKISKRGMDKLENLWGLEAKSAAPKPQIAMASAAVTRAKRAAKHVGKDAVDVFKKFKTQ
jgi:hypothetical protein